MVIKSVKIKFASCKCEKQGVKIFTPCFYFTFYQNKLF